MRFPRHSTPSGQPFDGSELGREGNNKIPIFENQLIGHKNNQLTR